MRTTAVLEVEGANGGTSFLVGSSRPTLTPAQRSALKAGETAVKGPGHAEVTVINEAKNAGQKPLRIGVSREPCTICEQKMIEDNIPMD